MFTTRSVLPVPFSDSRPTILIVGGTRGIGFEAYRTLLLKTLERPSLVEDLRFVLLVRSKSRFLSSKEFKRLPDEQFPVTDIVEGDVRDLTNVRKALNVAGTNLRAVVFSVGATASSGMGNATHRLFHPWERTSSNVCARGIATLMLALNEASSRFSMNPKIIAVSSMGVGSDALEGIPSVLRPVYRRSLRNLLSDKTAMEVILSQVLCAPSPSFPTTSFRRKRFPSIADADLSSFLSGSSDQSDSDESQTGGSQWKPETRLPPPFILPQSLCVLRPAILKSESSRKPPKELRVRQAGTLDENEPRLYNAQIPHVGDLVARLLGEDPDDEHLRELCWGYQVLVGE